MKFIRISQRKRRSDWATITRIRPIILDKYATFPKCSGKKECERRSLRQLAKPSKLYDEEIPF